MTQPSDNSGEQRAFRCSGELGEAGASQTSSTPPHQWWEIEDILPGYDFKHVTASATPGQ